MTERVSDEEIRKFWLDYDDDGLVNRLCLDLLEARAALVLVGLTLDATEQHLKEAWGHAEPPYAEAYGYLAQSVRDVLGGGK